MSGTRPVKAVSTLNSNRVAGPSCACRAVLRIGLLLAVRSRGAVTGKERSTGAICSAHAKRLGEPSSNVHWQDREAAILASSQRRKALKSTTSRVRDSCMSRKQPNILVTGTPGTGKTTTCQQIIDATGFTHINVGDWVKQHELHSGWDEEHDCYIIDEDKVSASAHSVSSGNPAEHAIEQLVRNVVAHLPVLQRQGITFKALRSCH